MNGSAVTLTFSGFLVDSTLYGSLSGSQLTLNAPQSNGTIQAGTCNAATLNDWNNAVTGLNNQASSDNSQAQQAQTSASAAASQSAAAQQSAQAAANQEQQAQADVSTLQGVSFSGDLSQLASDVKQTDNDVQQTRNDAAGGNGTDCENVQDTVYNDAASTVYNDVLSTVYNDVNSSLANDISSARSDIATVQKDQQGLAAAGLPGTSGAASAISAAQSAIANALSTANGLIDHANADLDAAYQIADSAATGGCAGDGPGNPPSGVSHLS